MPDWLSNLASTVNTVGSFIGSAIKSTVDPDIGSFDINRGNQGVVDLTHTAMGAAGTAMSAVSDKDPTKVITGPFLSGLHDLGVGTQGDEWDKGLVGIIGSGFQKAGPQAAYVSLATTGSTWTDPVSGMAMFNSALNQKAWDTAFNPAANVGFGAAMLSSKSIL